MTRIKTAREAALEALCDIRRRKVFASDALLRACEEMDAREAALAYRLTMTVMQNRLLLDAALDGLRPEGVLEPLVRDLLRLGAAQLFYTRVPARAAVNETVNLARSACPKASGLVNAMLRKLALQTPEQIAEKLAGPPGTRASLELRHSLPHWLSEELLKRLSLDEAESFAKATGGAKPTTLIENPLFHGDKPECGQAHPFLRDARLLDGAAARAPGFSEGRWLVADAGARAIVTALELCEGQSIWDTCAAPGGKSFLSAMDMGGTGRVLATDIAVKKLSKIREGAKRLGIDSIDIRQADASRSETEIFDAVLCDVPCSGLGVLASKPDIRYKEPADFVRLPEVQYAILQNAAKAVRPGGILVYSTCTFREAENEAVTGAFLRDHPAFQLESFRLPFTHMECVAQNGEITLWPHLHGTDGFYMCKMRNIS